MANEYVNKVELGSETLIDLTGDTAAAGDVVYGQTFHLRSGAPATGSLDSKVAASGGTDLSLVTTGEKYTWNNKAEKSLTADEYSSSATYSLGQLCIKDNVLYRCTTAILTAEAWNSAHWAATTIADEFERIGFHDMIKVTLPGITSLPKIFNVTGVTADHEFIQDGYAQVTPSSSVGSEWSVTTGAGTVQVTGTFSGNTSTTIKVTLGIPNKKVTGVAQ